MLAQHSEALDVSDVPDGEDWQNQKDRLLENAHNSIKQVQNYASGLQNISTPLQIKDHSVQKLCQQLDFIFLHGLRHIANGYWSFVKEFTHKDAIDSIMELEHVRSNIGRGRAWLYMTLNECLLESYLRSFTANSVLIGRYYTRNAIIRDSQKSQMITTLVAGLENVIFQLEYDLPFLNYTAFPPNNDGSLIIRKDSSFSSISLSSSILSQESKLSPKVFWNILNNKNSLAKLVKNKHSIASVESTTTSHDGDSGIETMENSQLNILDRNARKQPVNERIARIMEMDLTPDANTIKTEDGLESIEVSTRRRKKKKPSRMNGVKLQPILIQDGSFLSSPEPGSFLNSPEPSSSSSDVTPTEVEKVSSETLQERPTELEEIKPNVDTPDIILDSQTSKAECLEVKPAIKLRDKSGERKNPAKRVSFEIDLIANDVNMNFYSNSSSESAGDTPVNERETTVPSSPAETSIYDRSCVVTKKQKCRKRSGFRGLAVRVDEADFTNQSREFEEKMKNEIKNRNGEENVDYHIKVDNNTLLKLMLSAFKDDEQLFKMFHASVGHTQDELKLVFLVLTNKRIYLIEHGLCQRHYFVSKVITYDELDYLLLGLNYQTIFFVCKRRRKNYMLCTGDENLTKNIISHVEIAIRTHGTSNNVPNVFTDSKMQTIGLEKWIAKETNIERHEVNILHYVLVHWEDPLSISLLECPAGPSKDGYLMYRFHCHDSVDEPAMETAWTPAFFALRAGVLYQFSVDEGSNKLQMYIRLHSPDFRGCRRVSSFKRPHIFELKLDVGRVLHLAAPDDYEASQWMQAILKTISMKVNDDNIHPFKSCCLVLTKDKLLVCQEDLDLYTCTTLGSADLVNLANILADSSEPKYCILEFDTVEANVFAGDWILYFNSDQEADKFFTALATAWEELFKVPFEKKEIMNSVLRDECRDRVEVIQNSWKLGYGMLREPIAVIENFPSPK